MKRQLMLSWAALARHLSASAALRDLGLLITLGALASFAILFTTRAVFDDTVHELGLRYQARMLGAPTAAGDLRLDAHDSAVAAPASAAGGPHGGRTVNLTVLVFDDGAPVSAWLAGAVRHGHVCRDGMMLDEATAAHFGVDRGDRLTLWWPELSGSPSAVVRVCAILDVWHPGGALGARGYAVMARAPLVSATPAFIGTAPDETMDYWFRTRPPGSESKPGVIGSILADQAGWSTAVIAVALIGAGLWSFGIARVSSAVRRSVETPWRVLGRLGTPPGLLAAFVAAVTLTLASVGSVASAVLARRTIMGWTDLYVTSRQIVVVVGGLFVLSVLVVLARGPRPRWRRWLEPDGAAKGGRL